MQKRRWIHVSALVAVFVLAAVLRLYRLDWADVINDEALIGFRSIGLIDFFSSPYQTTPWQWFSHVPDWAHLSFHDHPPAVFLSQYLSFLFFGISVFSMRLPLALAGIVAVLLVYLIGKELFSPRTGLLAAALFSVSSYHVWVSRIGLQESMVITFLLLAMYLFICAQKTGKHWGWGIALGLALLTKYTALFLVPVFIAHQFIVRREELSKIRFWFGFALVIVIFSPVIIYNVAMYRAVGHFDLQFSYLFKQDVPEWAYLPGKIEAGSFIDRVYTILPAISRGVLLPQTIVVVVALLWFAVSIYRTRRRGEDQTEAQQGMYLILLALGFLLCLLLFIGPTKRFVSMVTPFVALFVAYFIVSQKRFIAVGLVAVLLPLELFFTVNSLFAASPIGREGVTYSYAGYDSQRWGYNDLNQYIERLISGKRPALSFPTKYIFLEEIKRSALVKAEKEGKQPEALIFIYDPVMYETATFWIFHRQLVYAGWPVITADDFVEQGEQYWRAQGISSFHYFKTLDPLALFDDKPLNASTTEAMWIKVKDVVSEKIKRPDGREVFEVYRW